MNKRVSAASCGKIILFGEHAVVYGRPAIAVPVTHVQATATIAPNDHGLIIHAADIDRSLTADSAGCFGQSCPLRQCPLQDLPR